MHVERILHAALAAADPREAVRRIVRDGLQLASGEEINWSQYGRVRVVGMGKAAPAMTRGLLDQLGERVDDGVVIAKHVASTSDLGRVQVRIGSHPVPDDESLASTRALVDFLREGRPDDLVICLISGGGSALMTLPYEGITLEDLQSLTRLLLASGADITEINTLRKHLDQVKGGGLARLAAPAQVVTLILSDVIGSPLDAIASGPTAADPTTYSDALGILEKYNITVQTPGAILDHLRRGGAGELPETVKPGDPLLERVSNRIVASNLQAAQAALDEAARGGFHALLLTTYLQGEASQAGVALAGILKQAALHGQPLPRPCCLVAGGETTVTLRGQGMGGRNQELALGAAFVLSGVPNAALVALATDGEDGPTDAAGAVVTGETLARARQSGLDPQVHLRQNDSYHLFAALDDLILTGPTGTNVNDLVFLFAF